MRNVFDQYEQAENRLTHALFSSLAQDRQLLKSFIETVCKVSCPQKTSTIAISVQRYPDGTRYGDDDVSSASIPDAWISDQEGWALVFEAKIGATLSLEQLQDHRTKAQQFDFDRARFFCLTAKDVAVPDSDWTTVKWSEIYVWLRSEQSNRKWNGGWAALAADYFEILEAKLMDEGALGDGELTVFSGFFPNENDYSYLQAKAHLRSAMRVLRERDKLVRELGMQPGSPGRGAITGKDSDAVWDLLRMRGAQEGEHFTKNPHLTLGVARRAAEAMVTFPNGLRSPVRNRFKQLGEDGIENLLAKVMRRMEGLLAKEPRARPIVRVNQRRYPSQRSIPIVDALLEFDLRTITPSEKGMPKHQTQWLDAAIGAFLKKKSNLQLQVGISFGYGSCPTASTPEAAKLIENGWLACKPILDAVLDA